MIVYKLTPRSSWSLAEESAFEGSAVDLADGYIHLSTAETVRETAAKHFSGQADLVIVAVDAARLGPALKWEVSRGGALFPHLYAPLRKSDVLWVKPLPLVGGEHVFPGEVA